VGAPQLKLASSMRTAGLLLTLAAGSLAFRLPVTQVRHACPIRKPARPCTAMCDVVDPDRPLRKGIAGTAAGAVGKAAGTVGKAAGTMGKAAGTAAGTVGKAAGTAAGTVGKAAGTAGKAAGTVGKAAGTEATSIITWLAMMLAVETTVILQLQRPLAIVAGLGLAATAVAVTSPWSQPLIVWRLLVKMGAGGAATAAVAVAAGVTAGIAASGVYGIWLRLRGNTDLGRVGVRADIATAVEFGIPSWALAAAAGALSSRTVALAPIRIQAPLRFALLALLVGGGGGSFCFMTLMAGASLEADNE